MADRIGIFFLLTIGNQACPNYGMVFTAYDRMFKKKPKNPV